MSLDDSPFYGDLADASMGATTLSEQRSAATSFRGALPVGSAAAAFVAASSAAAAASTASRAARPTPAAAFVAASSAAAAAASSPSAAAALLRADAKRQRPSEWYDEAAASGRAHPRERLAERERERGPAAGRGAERERDERERERDWAPAAGRDERGRGWAPAAGREERERDWAPAAGRSRDSGLSAGRSRDSGPSAGRSRDSGLSAERPRGDRRDVPDHGDPHRRSPVPYPPRGPRDAPPQRSSAASRTPSHIARPPALSVAPPPAPPPPLLSFTPGDLLALSSLSEPALGAALGAALGECKLAPLAVVGGALGGGACAELLQRTAAACASRAAPALTADGSRARSAGGTFFALLKAAHPEAYRAAFAEETRARHLRLTAKRRTERAWQAVSMGHAPPAAGWAAGGEEEREDRRRRARGGGGGGEGEGEGEGDAAFEEGGGAGVGEESWPAGGE